MRTKAKPKPSVLADPVADLVIAVDALARAVADLEHAVRNLPDQLTLTLDKAREERA